MPFACWLLVLALSAPASTSFSISSVLRPAASTPPAIQFKNTSGAQQQKTIPKKPTVSLICCYERDKKMAALMRRRRGFQNQTVLRGQVKASATGRAS